MLVEMTQMVNPDRFVVVIVGGIAAILRGSHAELGALHIAPP